MFDCSGPTLVFVTQTHHPILEHHTGYIFALYDVHYYKPKEMFFRHIAEAQVFALYRKARLEMNPDSKPDRVTALAYVLNAEDESRFEAMHHSPTQRGHAEGSFKRADSQAAYEFEAQLLDMVQEPEPDAVPATAINFFGEE